MKEGKILILKRAAIACVLFVFLAFGVFGQELLSQIAPEAEDESESTATIVQIAQGDPLRKCASDARLRC